MTIDYKKVRKNFIEQLKNTRAIKQRDLGIITHLLDISVYNTKQILIDENFEIPTKKITDCSKCNKQFIQYSYERYSKCEDCRKEH